MYLRFTNFESSNPRCIKQQSDLTYTEPKIALKGLGMSQSLCDIHSNISTSKPVSTKLGMNSMFHKPVQSYSCSRCQKANCCTALAVQQIHIRGRFQKAVQCSGDIGQRAVLLNSRTVWNQWLVVHAEGWGNRERYTGLIVDGGIMCNKRS
jgi:hypothetical protein